MISAATAPLLLTDGYKLDHRRQYPKGTTRVYSNYTNRSSRIEGVDKVVHFGLQAFCQKYLMDVWEPFFAGDVDEICEEYGRFIDSYVGPNEINTDHIRELHAVGYLPLRICAHPEGTLVPIGIPSLTIENTRPEQFWLVNYLETPLSASLWHPSTTATIAREYRKILNEAARLSGASIDDVAFQAHDFSTRGQTSLTTAAASGAGHLLSFTGSDSLPSKQWIEQYYPGENKFLMGGVPATEHSVMCAGGQDDEMETYRRLLDLYPSGVVSVVSDTWDLWNVLTTILPALRDQIRARDGKLVIRPDSGDPETILCGDHRAESGSPANLGVVRILAEHFGATRNEAGYRVLDSKVGAIYGDSITLERARSIVERLRRLDFASTNVVFGIGSYTYQYVTRDTFSSAVKATWVEIDGEGRDIRKDPITDAGGMKRSASGRLSVVRNRGEMTLIEGATPELEAASLLQPVWQNGHYERWQSFDDVRNVLAEQNG